MFRPGLRSYANVTAIDVVDPHTVKISLKSPDPFFLASLATDTESVGLLVCKKAFETRGASAMRLSPIGTGPFRFKEYVSKDRVVMVRNDAYWAGKPHLDEVVVRFMPSSAAASLHCGPAKSTVCGLRLTGRLSTGSPNRAS